MKYFILELHYAYANGTIQYMTCLLLTHPKKENEDSNYIVFNIRCCTCTYCTNSITISSYAYQHENAKCKIVMLELHIFHNFKSNSTSNNKHALI
jgi:Tfp pilus assembly protein PilE